MHVSRLYEVLLFGQGSRDNDEVAGNALPGLRTRLQFQVLSPGASAFSRSRRARSGHTLGEQPWLCRT